MQEGFAREDDGLGDLLATASLAWPASRSHPRCMITTRGACSPPEAHDHHPFPRCYPAALGAAGPPHLTVLPQAHPTPPPTNATCRRSATRAWGWWASHPSENQHF